MNKIPEEEKMEEKRVLIFSLVQITTRNGIFSIAITDFTNLKSYFQKKRPQTSTHSSLLHFEIWSEQWFLQYYSPDHLFPKEKQNKTFHSQKKTRVASQILLYISSNAPYSEKEKENVYLREGQQNRYGHASETGVKRFLLRRLPCLSIDMKMSNTTIQTSEQMYSDRNYPRNTCLKREIRKQMIYISVSTTWYSS